MQKLTYAKLRTLTADVLKNEQVKTGLQNAASAGILATPELLNVVLDSGADKRIIEELSEKPYDQLSPQEVGEVLDGFFAAMKASWGGLLGLRSVSA